MKQFIKYATPLLFIAFLMPSCVNKEIQKPFFPGVYPGKALGRLTEKSMVLSDNAIVAEWGFIGKSIYLKQIRNRYDGKRVDLSKVILFAVETDDGRHYTNLDFKLKSLPDLKKLAVSDSAPTASLRFPGLELSASMRAPDGNLEILWKAQLRDGSNYILQNIQITASKHPVRITRVIFYDGQMDDASYSGMVIGSPITCRNLFFGLEHPIALSKALLDRNIGPVTGSPVDVSGIIDSAGDYLLTVELGSSSEYFDVRSVSLLEDGKIICTDEHPLLGEGGKGVYKLPLGAYHPGAVYTVQADLINGSKANGDFHITRRTNDVLNFYVNRRDELKPGKSISEWSVAGVSPEGQNRRAFLYYLERERAHPYRQFLHYNCWWDITTDGASSFTSDQIVERIKAWNEKFMAPFGVKVQSFAFDDGWDNLDSIWYFDPVRFPDGFKPEAELCRKFNSGIGVWMSPFGGYGATKLKRLESGRRQGLETNEKGLSLAGANYYDRFVSRAVYMLDSSKVNYFKFDGFGGSEPKYLPDMESGARLIQTLRHHNPDVFINITTGSWPSPFWLKLADCTWRGSGDLHMAGKGTRTSRFMTYRDGTLYSNIVRKAPDYPLNSIMTVGIAYANLGLPKMCINDSISDFSDMVWSYFGSGSSLQELYISHDRMKTEFWPILADGAKWVRSNENVLHDTHWVGGSPLNLEVYGFASWIPAKGIITLRNPDDKPKEFDFTLDNLLELPEKYKGNFIPKRIRDEDTGELPAKIESSEVQKLTLKPYQVFIFEVIPERNKPL
jgi:hypothetical protein